MDLNFDFDPMDIIIGNAGGELEVEDILARQEAAREALEDQMRKAQAMLGVLVKKRDEQVQMYRDVVQRSNMLGDEVLNSLVDEKDALDQEIEDRQRRSLRRRESEQVRANSGNGKRRSSVADINDDEDELQELIARRAVLASRLERIRNPPFRRLPPEIVQQIFLHCAFTRGGKRDPEFFGGGTIFLRPHLNKAPLVFTRVCKAWRSLALSLPVLWSSVYVLITEEADNSFKCQPPLPVLEEWIKRAGVCPLTFQICESRLDHSESSDDSLSTSPALGLSLSNDGNKGSERGYQAAIQLFIPHYARWEAARFKLPMDANLEDVFKGLPENASYPLLQDLLISRGFWERNVQPASAERISCMLRNSPLLHTFRWGSRQFAAIANDVPWAKLRVLKLESIMSMERFRYVLTEAPHLESLSVHVMLGSQNGPTSFVPAPDPENPNDRKLEDPRLHLSNMQELAINYEGPGYDLKSFMNNTTMPALKSFTVSAETLGIAPHAWPHEEFLSFVNRSRCQIEFLAMHNVKCKNEDEMLALLEAISSSVWHLGLHCDKKYGFVTDRVLRALEVPYSHARFDNDEEQDEDESGDPVSSTHVSEGTNTRTWKVLCPKLEYLSLWNCLSSTDGVLSDMVASRRTTLRPPGVANLGSVILTLDNASKHKTDIEVFEMLNEGQWGITYITV